MDPEQFELLGRLVHETARMMAEGREGVFEDEDEQPDLTAAASWRATLEKAMGSGCGRPRCRSGRRRPASG